MAIELSKTYHPQDFENKWYQFWLKNDFFAPKKGKKNETFTIVIPPPNVTAVLHLGHGLNNTIQDILIRYKRMSGYQTLWVPGTDHAGIATQNVVERELAREGKKKSDFTRQSFEERVWQTALKHQKLIIKQLEKMGCSADWKRNAFTFDEARSKAVNKVFIDLYQKGKIYKSKYIVNWCPRCNTALADDEVEHEEKNGKLWHIKYPIKNSNDFIIIATTRPETMLGDTAVAFNPGDQRYQKCRGQFFQLPLTNRTITAVFDDYVDPQFGTGAVKITPAHDPNDFEIGQRHQLEFINIMTDDGIMNKNVPQKYQGLDRFHCRKKVVEDLEKEGLLVKIEEHSHAVGTCYRCSTVVEPRYSDQWFVKMKELAKPALDAVKNGEIEFLPARWIKVYYNWLENIKDWCISRQLWWGHRIPIYYCDSCHEIIAALDKPEKCHKCGHDQMSQDPDVLDTWFSSWLWPFSTLGWPEKTADLEQYYPTSTLVTAPEIIFFWVARMIMAGLFFIGKIPFNRVFYTGTVMDLKGRKMSKSLGNGIDPFDVIDRHGADAMRYTLIAIVNPNQNFRLGFPGDEKSKDIDSFETGAKFANKIWNASRFIMMNIPAQFQVIPIDQTGKNIFDRWILHEFNQTVLQLNDNFEKARFNDAAKNLQSFFWNSFCDWYVELSKSKIFSQDEKIQKNTLSILLFVLKNFLKLLHPVMPFITEEIYQKLPDHGLSIMVEEYPQMNESLFDQQASDQAARFFSLIHLIRNIRGEMNVPVERKINVLLKTSDQELEKMCLQYEKDIHFLTRAESIRVEPELIKPEGAAAGTNEFCEVYIPLEGIIDIELELKRLSRDLEKNQKDLTQAEKKLNNQNFIDKAPPEVIEKEKNKLEEFKSKCDKLVSNIDLLKKIE